MRRGRPLRFLAVVLGGWTTARIALLLPDAAPLATPSPQPALVAGRERPAQWLRGAMEHPPLAAWPLLAAGARPVPARDKIAAVAPASPAPTHLPRDAALALAALVRFVSAVSIEGAAPQSVPTIPSPVTPVPVANGTSRLAGSAWLIARGGANRDPLAGQLGGSQAGARLTYLLDRGHRLAASARIAGPLGGGGGTEAGLGVDWQPTRAPLHLIAEQRVPLDGGRGGPAVLAVGGIGPTVIALAIRVEAYAQGGVVFRDRAEGFGDGAVRVTTSVAGAGGVRLDLGIGGWGGIQRGARRLDLGPTLGAAVPVAGRAIRLTLDWRQRVAGDARPGSGPALSVGADF